MRVAGGIEEDGVVVGNTYDKYNSSNPLVNRIMRGFHSALEDLVGTAAPDTIHEVGCGEGYWVNAWNRAGFAARGSDFSPKVIEIARENASLGPGSADRFQVKSIYDLDPAEDAADLVVCCEVLEHLEDPVLALRQLQRTAGQHLIVSVPREPLWSFLNVARGKYWSSLGNTPGHIQRWSKREFVDLVSDFFDPVSVRSPIPWTMMLCRARDKT